MSEIEHLDWRKAENKEIVEKLLERYPTISIKLQKDTVTKERIK